MRAVAMQQAITARPADAEPLSIKIGVAVGDAEVEDGDYFGLPVVEAARLCAKAQGGRDPHDRVRAHAGAGRAAMWSSSRSGRWS